MAGRVGGGVFVVVVVDLVAGAAAVGGAVRVPSCVCSFHGVGIIIGYLFDLFGRLKSMVGGAPG